MNQIVHALLGQPKMLQHLSNTGVSEQEKEREYQAVTV